MSWLSEAWNGLTGKSAADAANSAAAQARAEEEARQQRIRQGQAQVNDIFGRNFTDAFYQGRQNAYLNYATPQLDRDYEDARKKLTFALDRAGTLNSSVRAEKEAELDEVLAKQQQAVRDKALGYANTARNNVEGARSELISALNASGDATAAVNSANNRIATLSAQDTFSPLTGLFTGFTGALNTQAALEKAAHYSGGAVKPTYNTGLFTPGSGSVVTRA